MGDILVAEEDKEKERKAKRLMEIFQKSQLSEEDGKKLAEELAEAVARRHDKILTLNEAGGLI